MLCMTCSTDIPPAWKGALKSNLCPACSGPIFDDQTTELMEGLKTALEQMSNDPQGIAGWLLSNYRMEKVGDGEPTGFYGVKSNQVSPNDETPVTGLKINSNPLQQYLKRAGVKPGDQEKYKALAEEINSANISVSEDDINVPADPNEVEESNYPDYTNKALQAMVPKETKAGKGKASLEADNDFSGLHPALHEDRLKRLEAQQNIASGIRKKGSFSRSD